MASLPPAGRFRFLFRQDEGTVDRRTWIAGAGAILAIWLVLLGAVLLANRTGGIARVGISGLFVIATMLLAACYYFLSAKRFRDRGRSPLLALVLPAVGLATAALNTMQPATGGTFPLWFAFVADAALAGVAVWNAVELGYLPDADVTAERRDG